MSEVVRRARETRCAAEQRERLLKRIRLVDDCMSGIFPLISPTSVSFLPSGSPLLEIKGLAELLVEDKDPSDELRQTVLQTLPTVLPEIQLWVSTRARDLYERLDGFLPTGIAAPEGSAVAGSSSDEVIDFTSTFLNLDLAIHVFKCTKQAAEYPSSNLKPLFGLDALAHLPCWVCRSEPEIIPSAKGSTVVNKILKLHGLEPSRTRPIDLDVLEHRYTCDECTSTDGPRGVLPVCGWRALVRGHASNVASFTYHLQVWSHTDGRQCDTSKVRLLTSLENRYVDAFVRAQSWTFEKSVLGKAHVWGCGHCSQPWSSLSDVKDHLLAS